MTGTAITAQAVIEDALVAFTDAAVIPQVADLIMARLRAAGVLVINPQDAAWGSCADNPDEDAPDQNGPHEISTSLCVWCLQYDPE